MALSHWLFLLAVLVWCGGLAAATHAALRELEPTAFRVGMPLRLLRPGVLLIAHYAGRRLRATWRADCQTRLVQAGVGAQLGPAEWFALRSVLAALAACAAFAAALRSGGASWLAPLPAAVAGEWLPEAWLRLRTWRRQRRIARELVLYLELLLAGLECGLVPRRALQAAIAAGPPGLLGGALCGALQDAGTSCEADELMRRLARRLQAPACSAVIAALLKAQASGVGLARALRGLITRREHLRVAQAEQSAREIRRRILRPLAVCFAPSLIVAVAWPAVERIRLIITYIL